MVSHTGPIHGPGVNVVRVGAHYDVPEHPVCCECHVWMMVQGVQVVPVVVYGPVQPSQALNCTSMMAWKLRKKSHCLK